MKRVSSQISSIDPQSLVNKDLPYTMHIDLNSCFAIIEQQANRLLRGRPVGVAAYDTSRGFVLAASYEAKAKNIKLGVNVEQSRSMAPGIVIMTPDPAKYREAHRLFKAVLLEYSPDVTPKSIDEFILYMEHSPALRNIKNEKLKTSPTEERVIHNQAMLQIGKEIKTKITERLGEWVTVNIGISTNRFLAKYAAGFGKPDGMLLIDHNNLDKWYRCGKFHECNNDAQNCKSMSLVDLPGINTRFRARLRNSGIYTPLEFLDADMQLLKKQVFKSINGYHWYMRLRGYEADAVEFTQKSIGHQHALSDKTMDIEKLERLLIKLCEKTGRRLRKGNYYASGIHLYLGFVREQSISDSPIGFENMHELSSWHHGEKVQHRLYSTIDIYEAAKKLLVNAEIPRRVSVMSVHVFGLSPWNPEQLSIFDTESRQEGVRLDRTNYSSISSRKRVTDAVDAINNRYGEFVITPAMMLDMQGTILDRIAFGQVRDL
jgi:DNA polymerase-4